MLWRTELRHCKFYLMLRDYLNLLMSLAWKILQDTSPENHYMPLVTFNFQHAVIYQTLIESIFVKSLLLNLFFYQDNFIYISHQHPKVNIFTHLRREGREGQK